MSRHCKHRKTKGTTVHATRLGPFSQSIDMAMLPIAMSAHVYIKYKEPLPEWVFELSRALVAGGMTCIYSRYWTAGRLKDDRVPVDKNG